MTREEGIRQIDGAPWSLDDDGCLNLYVNDRYGMPVHAWLTKRPNYCDRGHLQLNMDIRGQLGIPDLDTADAFPRYFFSFDEADVHTRRFLKWRLWQERSVPEAAICSAFHD